MHHQLITTTNYELDADSILEVDDNDTGIDQHIIGWTLAELRESQHSDGRTKNIVVDQIHKF